MTTAASRALPRRRDCCRGLSGWADVATQPHVTRRPRLPPRLPAQVSRSLAACEGCPAGGGRQPGCGGADAGQCVPGAGIRPGNHPCAQQDRPARCAARSLRRLRGWMRLRCGRSGPALWRPWRRHWRCRVAGCRWRCRRCSCHCSCCCCCPPPRACACCAAGADPERVKREIEEVIGLDCSNAIMASAKQVRRTRWGGRRCAAGRGAGRGEPGRGGTCVASAAPRARGRPSPPPLLACRLLTPHSLPLQSHAPHCLSPPGYRH